MSLPNRSTKLKVAFGYILLTALLFISIGYIYQEMKSLTGTSDDEAILSQRRHVTNQIIGQLYQADRFLRSDPCMSRRPAPACRRSRP